MSPSLKTHGMLLLAVLVLSACSSEPPTEPVGSGIETSSGSVAILPHNSFQRPHEAAMEALGLMIPGFGGLFADSAGVVYVYLLDLSKRSLAERAVRDLLGGGEEEGVAGFPSSIRVLKGQYDLMQLKGWYEKIRHDAMNLPGVQVTDLDEARNRIRIEVYESDALALVRKLIKEHDVPLDAVLLEETEPIIPYASLSDSLRPLRGGNKIAMPWGGNCTMGFNATWVAPGGQVKKVFLTASHCTNSVVRPGDGQVGALFYQPNVTSSRFVGTEIADPMRFTGGSCPSNRECRWSDTAIVQHANPSASFALGTIHKTLWRGTASGSTTIDSSNPYFTLIGEKSSPHFFTMLNKMGHNTGWTGNRYEYLCGDIKFIDPVTLQDTGITLLCQDAIDAGFGPGDSGAPIFSRTSSTSTQGYIYGIAWAGNGDIGIYSAMINIEYELGNLTTF